MGGWRIGGWGMGVGIGEWGMENGNGGWGMGGWGMGGWGNGKIGKCVNWEMRGWGNEGMGMGEWKMGKIVDKEIGGCWQGRVGPAAPPPLRAVGPWLNHAFFINLYVVKHI